MERFFEELWMILVESSVWLLVGFAIAGAVHAVVPREWMLKHLSGGGFWPIAKASMLGIPLPLCSCSVIPVAAGLRDRGASKGASAAFAISTPQTGEESIPITWALFGPVYALTRPVVAVVTGLIAGLLIDATSREDDGPETIEDPNAVGLSIVNAGDADAAAKSCCSSGSPAPAKTSCCSGDTPRGSSCCADTPARAHTTLGEKIKIGLKHGFGTMLIDLAIWLAVGLVLAALIGALVPEDWIGEHLGSGIAPKLLMLLVGIPLYVCATSSTPLAWSLVAAGLSPGAALVMLLSGPATNVATMSWVIKDLGIRALVIYLSVIGAVALGAGIVFDAALGRFVEIADSAALHEHAAHGFGVKEAAAVVFVVLMAWALGMKARAWMNRKGWGTTEKPTTGGCCSSSGGGSCGCS
ncbi:MAG: SO_0444 family Cu/Zn efflux transporter [Phycisphaerales bacterium]|nr:SO_0444 family Cu/Zn efflux transporter [Phycisphaerales bacterium]